MNASITAHSILGVVLWHRKMRLIQWCVVDAIHEIRSIWLLGFEPWDLDAWRCDIVNCHIAGRWWNWRKRERRRWTWYKFNVIQLNGININMICIFSMFLRALIHHQVVIFPTLCDLHERSRDSQENIQQTNSKTSECNLIHFGEWFCQAWRVMKFNFDKRVEAKRWKNRTSFNNLEWQQTEEISHKTKHIFLRAPLHNFYIFFRECLKLNPFLFIEVLLSCRVLCSLSSEQKPHKKNETANF